MAEGKKSFIVYSDSKSLVDKLPDETAGKLFKMLFAYVNDESPKTDDVLLDIAFEHFRQKLKSDLRKWGEIKVKRSESGRKGGLAKQANARSAKKILANQAVTVNDNVSVNVNVNDIKKRKADFQKSLLPFWDEYDKDLLNDFFGYWTEHGEKDKKMRFEKEKSFGLSRRLATWKKREKNFAPKKEKPIMLADKMKQEFNIR